MNFREVGWDGVDWIGLAKDRDKLMALVNAVMNIRKLSTGFRSGGLSSSAQLQSVS
jgi:hypothetical protein